MTWYEEMSPWEMPGLTSVGWLELGRSYPQGNLQEGFPDKLIELLLNPWQPAVTAGSHDCGLCRLSKGPRRLAYKGKSVELGSNNLFVPGPDTIFVAPSLIAHYIDAHAYAPPLAFQDAVMACPEMRSMAYLKALRGSAPKGFISKENK